MPVTDLDWVQTDEISFAATNIQEYLDGVESVINDHKTKNPSTYKWDISQGVTANGGGGHTLELMPSVNSSANNTIRILLFGGAVPDEVNAEPSGKASSYIYLALKGEGTGTTGPDNDFTTANEIYSTDTYIGGFLLAAEGNAITNDKIYFLETDEMIRVVSYDSGGNNCQSFSAGKILINVDNDGTLYGVMVNGAAGIIHTAFQSTSFQKAWFHPTSDSGYTLDDTTTSKAGYIRANGTKGVFKIYHTVNKETNMMTVGGNNKIITWDVPVCDVDLQEFVGKIRQEQCGPRNQGRKQITNQAGTKNLFAVGARVSAEADCIYCVHDV